MMEMTSDYLTTGEGPLPIFHSIGDALAQGYDCIATHVPERFDRTRRVFIVVRRRQGMHWGNALVQCHG